MNAGNLRLNLNRPILTDMPNTRLTIDCSEEQIQIFDEIAANLDTDRASVIADALTQYIADYKAELLETDEALAELEAGKTLSNEQVIQQFAERARKAQAA